MPGFLGATPDGQVATLGRGGSDLTATLLGRVLGRPTVAPAPAFALRLAFGEMADATVLASARVRPQRLLDAGFRFRFPRLEDALRHVLGRTRA